MMATTTTTTHSTPTISFQNTPSTGLAGEIFTIPLSSASHSTLLSDLLEDLFDLSPSSSPPHSDIIIPLMIDRTSDAALSTIAAWLTHNTPLSPPSPPNTSPASFSGSRPASVLPLQGQDDEDDRPGAPLPAWEHALLDVPYPRLFEVMIAANYLGMERLGRQAAQVVGERLRGLTAAQIRRVLCIEEDELSAEQRAQAEWVRERGEQDRRR